MKTIEELLIEVGEDKHQNLTTTSFKFKTDLWNFFQGSEDKIAVEFGTHKGQTTRILSYLFKTVHTVNNSDNEYAKNFNFDRTNIYYHNVNLYSSAIVYVNEPVDLFLIDAGHGYDHVVSDLNRAFNMKRAEECYIAFDDYGLIPEVRAAVDAAIKANYLEVVQEIGHQAGHNFGTADKGGADRVLEKSEGLITRML